MDIFKIPNDKNKYQYVLEILSFLQNAFIEYSFINYTEAPINEFVYSEDNGVYFRELQLTPNPSINKSLYLSSYDKDNLIYSGFTLEEYIDMCLLFELNRIEIVEKCTGAQIQINSNNHNSIATLLICPDGYSEIHFEGSTKILNRLMSFVNTN